MTVDASRRVLVVDDDPEVRGILSTILQQKGLVVDTAENGQMALERTAENRYSVVVLDLFMPVVDGFAVLDTMRHKPEPKPVVLVLTAADASVTERLDASLIHGVVRKPFDPVDLAGVITACAEIRGRSAFETMALAAMIAGTPFVTFLSR